MLNTIFISGDIVSAEFFFCNEPRKVLAIEPVLQFFNTEFFDKILGFEIVYSEFKRKLINFSE